MTSPAANTRPRLDVLGVDAGVADVRIRQRDDLPGVRRVGQDFLVAGHRGVEHHFAGRAGRARRSRVRGTRCRRPAPGAPAWSGQTVGSGRQSAVGSVASGGGRTVDVRTGKAWPSPLYACELYPEPAGPSKAAVSGSGTLRRRQYGRAEAAVDVEQVPGDVIGGGGREEYRGAGDFRRVAPAPGRRALVAPTRRTRRRRSAPCSFRSGRTRARCRSPARCAAPARRPARASAS